MTHATRRALFIVIVMFFAWNAGVLINGQNAAPAAPASTAAPVLVAPAQATQPSDVEVDQPATPTTEVPSPAAPEHAQEQVMWALMAAYALNHAKKSSWFPWLTRETSARAQAAWGFITAVLTVLGINVAIHGSFFDTGGMAVTFSGLSWSAFKDVAWQWAAQQGWYDFLVKRAGLSPSINA